eukprot:7994379-Alexandrium_andersonii.AAC.1
MSASLVGSEMCIRDSNDADPPVRDLPAWNLRSCWVKQCVEQESCICGGKLPDQGPFAFRS